MFRKLALICTLLVVGIVSVAFAQAKQDFTLVNRTGYVIDEVYVSPSKSSDWQDDVLGEGVMVNGKVVNIRFSRAAKTCKWDLKVVYDDKSTAEWDGFDLCTVSKITIYYDRKNDVTSADAE